MNNKELDLLKGKGIPYQHVYHLLSGTRKSKTSYYHDENITGYGWSSSDNEIKEINEMELQLGDLTSEILDLRTMIDLCCIWRYDYPERVHLICKAIGGSGDTASRCHYQVGTDKRDELTAYALALKKWLGESGDEGEVSLKDSKIGEEIEAKVFNMLGEKEEIKELLVERTLLGLVSRHIDCSFLDQVRKGNLSAFTQIMH